MNTDAAAADATSPPKGGPTRRFTRRLAASGGLFDQLGAGGLACFVFLASMLVLAKDCGVLTYIAIRSWFVERHHGKALFRIAIRKQLLFTSVMAIPLISLIGSMLGALAMITVFSLFITLRLNQQIAEELSIILLVNELAPLLVMLIVIARSGTAISTELAMMNIHHESDHYRVLGINLDYFIVLPRIIGMVVSLLVLLTVFCVLALGVGYLAAKALPESQVRIQGLVQNLKFANVCVAGSKAIVSGVLISTICCIFGFRAKGDPAQIPQMATRGVVNSILLCLGANLIISIIFLVNYKPPI